MERYRPRPSTLQQQENQKELFHILTFKIKSVFTEMKVLTQLIISFHSIIFSRLKLENNSFIRPSNVLHFAKHLTSPYWIKTCAEVDFETMMIVE